MNGQVINCNLRDKLFKYMKPVLDVHIFSEQAYVKILAYLKLIKVVHTSVLEFDVSKYMIKFWSMNMHDS